MSQVLRPRGAGEVIGQTFKLVFARLGMLMAIQFLFWLPVTLLVLFVVEQGVVTSETALTWVWVFIGWVLGPIPNAASILTLSDAFTGRKTDLGTCFATAIRRLPALVGLGLVTSLLYAVGAMLLLIPGLYFLAKYFVSTQVCVLEDRGVFAAMRRSAELSLGSKWQILGVMLVITLLSYCVAIPLGYWQLAAQQAGGDVMVDLVVQLVSNLLYGVLFASMGVAIYFNERVKKEQFDLDVLARLVDEIGTHAGDRGKH